MFARKTSDYWKPNFHRFQLSLKLLFHLATLHNAARQKTWLS